MAVFPSDVRFILAGAGVAESSLVERSDQERGPAKVRRVESDPTVTVSGTLLFRSAATLNDFRKWYYSRTGGNAGAGWFDWPDPLTGAVRQARFVAASLGPITPVVGQFGVSTRAASIEYVERL
jgi:hypothetical protein